MSSYPNRDNTQEPTLRIVRPHMTVIDDEAVRIARSLGLAAMGVYLDLEQRCGGGGTCWPSYQTIADDCGVCRRHVIDVMKKLVAGGLVVIRPRTAVTGGPTNNEFFLPYHRTAPSERPSEPDSLASERPSEPPSELSCARRQGGSSKEVVGEVPGVQAPADRPQPPAEKNPPPPRSTRIGDWRPTPDAIAWASVPEPEGLGLPAAFVTSETERFRDYWLGSGKPKVDWPATWRGWMRKESQNRMARVPATQNGHAPYKSRQQEAKDTLAAILDIAEGRA